jgi:hypothetical protein
VALKNPSVEMGSYLPMNAQEADSHPEKIKVARSPFSLGEQGKVKCLGKYANEHERDLANKPSSRYKPE